MFGIDSELYKMAFAVESNKNKINGFEGCINWRKCKFEGFYLCTYSPEGLCGECEIKEFPDRFYGCLFCREPTQYGQCCLDCESGFEKWVIKHTNISERAYISEYSAFRLCNPKVIVKHKFINIKRISFNTWSGFYVGNNKWVIPDVQLKTNTKITLNTRNSDEILNKLLDENGIFIFEDIQYKK